MSSIVAICIAETIFVLLLVAGLLLSHWRGKRRIGNELEALLDDIDDRQGLRGAQLARRLAELHRLDKTVADNLSGQLLDAEKQFLKTFIEQQVGHHSIADFYEKLCLLLDAYLIAAPEREASTVAPKPTEPTEQSQAPADGDNENAPPDWGDVFD